MSSNKKPRKRYTPRMPNIPMMASTRDDIAFALHAAVETLIHRPDIDAYNVVSTNLMTIGRACGKQDSIESAKQAMLDIFARYERVGKVGANDGEAARLRAAASGIDALLAGVPVNRWLAADNATAQQIRAAGVVG